MMTQYSDNKIQFIEKLIALGYTNTITRKQVKEVAENHGFKYPRWFFGNKSFRTDTRALFRVPSIEELKTKKTKRKTKVESVTKQVKNDIQKIESKIEDTISFIPNVNSLFVKNGIYNDLYKIVKSGKFYTTFITGLSGNGKTLMVEQACAKAGRELIRVNITCETDEDDLLGGFRLVDGETKWFDGPIVEAMKRGAILLLDEVDLASSRIMCLQPVLEGNSLLLKRINEIVKPKDGFNVIATANTKGQGDDSGKFFGTTILNEAFLERFSCTLNQDYPSKSSEKKIIQKVLELNGINDESYVDELCDFSSIIRKTYNDGAINDLISTRRLVHIANAFSIFGDKVKAIEVCLNRFDDHTRESFMALYDKLREDENIDDGEVEQAGEFNVGLPEIDDSLNPFKSLGIA